MIANLVYAEERQRTLEFVGVLDKLVDDWEQITTVLKANRSLWSG